MPMNPSPAQVEAIVDRIWSRTDSDEILPLRHLYVKACDLSELFMEISYYCIAMGCTMEEGEDMIELVMELEQDGMPICEHLDQNNIFWQLVTMAREMHLTDNDILYFFGEHYMDLVPSSLEFNPDEYEVN